MNNKPKFKKGDRVRVIQSIHTGELINMYDIASWSVMCDDSLVRIYYETDLKLLHSQTPDMLAIPDDHVFTETNNQQ